MKKIIIALFIAFMLCGCNNNKTTTTDDERYFDMIELINEYDNFLTTSNYYDISTDMAEIDGGYRYYVIIDNPRIALYDIKAIAVEKGVDYSSTMAANIGIFEEKEYSMIPNQSNKAKNFVEGIVISGITDKSETTLYVLVQWSNKDLSVTNREFFKLTARLEGEEEEKQEEETDTSEEVEDEETDDSQQ